MTCIQTIDGDIVLVVSLTKALDEHLCYSSLNGWIFNILGYELLQS